MRVVFHRLNGVKYMEEVNKVINRGDNIYFYKDGEAHYFIFYDVTLGIAKVYRKSMSIDCYDEVKNIVFMEITE